MKNETIMTRASLAAVALVLGFLLPASPAAAQAGEGSWRAWTGCWATQGAASAPTLCVIPSADPAIAEMVTVVDGAVVERERIEATGQRIARVREGCTGWESAEWSPDGRRLYSHSAHQCEGDLERTTSGIMSILPTGEWLNVQAVHVAGNTRVRVLRHLATDAPAVIRESVDNARVANGLALESARVAASSPITIAHAVEASRMVDPEAVEAWLIESEPDFQMNAARLVELADAGVPSSVIDVMVALSYPRVFAIDRDSRSADLQRTEYGRTGLMRPGIGVYSPWYDGFGRYSAFGYSPYGFGYGGMYPGYGYGWSNRPTVIIIRERDSEAGTRRGRLVNNHGYTDGSRPASTSRAPASSTARGNSGSATTSTTSSGSGSGSTATSSGSGGGRTAQPRQ